MEVRIAALMNQNGAPESPAINTFNLPIVLPRSVNGLLLGIRMLGMISCGSLSRASDGMSASSSSPSLDTIAWLAASPMDSSSECLKDLVDIDFGLLGIDEPAAGEASDGDAICWGV